MRRIDFDKVYRVEVELPLTKEQKALKCHSTVRFYLNHKATAVAFRYHCELPCEIVEVTKDKILR